MDELTKCPICENDNCAKHIVYPIDIPEREGQITFYSGTCKCCGNYLISQDFIDLVVPQDKIPIHQVIGVLRNLTIQRELFGDNKYYPIIDYKDVISSFPIPKSPIEKVNLLLVYLFNHQISFADYIKINEDFDYPLAFAFDKKEFTYLIKYAYEDELIEFKGSGNPFIQLGSGETALTDDRLKLSMKGWTLADTLINKLPDSKQAFVALKFDDNMLEVFDQAIAPALRECGYNPFITKDKEHNESINDVIISGIRNSGLVIVDVTGSSQNVYYEAGFAHGLNIPVILCCKEDRKTEDMKFDTSHIKHILWKDVEDFKQKLIKRIEASGLKKGKL